MDWMPKSCSAMGIGKARIREIKAIVEKLGNCEHGGRAFQNLPRHMQRRTISKNSQRLPRYLQQKHLREVGDNVKITKRPKKKYRHRPYNLLAEYNRRQLDNLWLETHVWHAKRFIMTRKWGYALAVSPTMKGYRSTIRAATKTCTVQDISYMCCIELEGNKECLLSGLSLLAQTSDIIKMKTPCVLQGRKWMSLTLFTPNRQPYGAIADVDIIFHPKLKNQEDTQHETVNIWIWVHPSAHSEVVQILKESFNLQLIDMEPNVPQTKKDNRLKSDAKENISPMQVDLKKDCASEETSSMEEELKDKDTEEKNSPMKEELKNDDAEEKVISRQEDLKCDDGGENNPMEIEVEGEEKEKHTNTKGVAKKEGKGFNKRFVNEAKIAKKNIPTYKMPKYISLDSKVKMTLLKDTINRFELTGPLAYSVLHAALVPTDISMENNNDIQGKPWWSTYYATENRQLIYKQQIDNWKSLSSTPPHVVVPLIIRDPRMSLPYKKLPLQEVVSEKCSEQSSEWSTESPFFSNTIRNEVTQTKESDCAINKKRSKMLVPGERNILEPNEAKVPVLLISRPTSHSAGHGRGWDILVPAGWAVNVWLSMIFCGGVAIGQRETLSHIREGVRPLPPYLIPDTSAAERYAVCQEQEKRKEFFSKPPAKRLNLIKFRVQYPFSLPWRRLVSDWNPQVKDFYVLRNQDTLVKIAELCGDASRKIKATTIGNKRKIATSTQNGPSKSIKTNLESKDESKTIKEDTKSNDHTSISVVNSILENLQKIKKGCLVLVKLEVEGKGIIEPNAMISLPVLEDLESRILPRKPTEHFVLEETVMEDTKAEERAQLQDEHNKIGRKLQRLRKKARKLGEKSTDSDTACMEESEKIINQNVTDPYEKIKEENKDIIAKYSKYQEAMEEAWLIPKADPLQCCMRKIMGYVLDGGFLQTLGYAGGIGWVCLEPLVQLLFLQKKFILDIRKDPKFENIWEKEKSMQPLVLVRCPTSLHYRWARVTIVLSPE